VVGHPAVASAQDALATVQSQLEHARLARAKIEHAIAVMEGRPPALFHIAARHFDPTIPAIPAGVPSALLSRRPDIAAAERRMAAASARIGVRTAELYPSITLGAGVGVRKGLFASADVKAPLYAGGSGHANVSHARAS